MPLVDISKSLHVFSEGDHVVVDGGIHKGWEGTIVWKTPEGAYMIGKSLLTLWQAISWPLINLVPEPGMPAHHANQMWKPRYPTDVVCVRAEEISYLDRSKCLAISISRDFLAGKRVMVCGAHEYKGAKGFVASVDVECGFAQVSLDAKTLTTNQLFSIALDHLLLDISNSR